VIATCTECGDHVEPGASTCLDCYEAPLRRRPITAWCEGAYAPVLCTQVEPERSDVVRIVARLWGVWAMQPRVLDALVYGRREEARELIEEARRARLAELEELRQARPAKGRQIDEEIERVRRRAA
jgi:hypothetical protein